MRKGLAMLVAILVVTFSAFSVGFGSDAPGPAGVEEANAHTSPCSDFMEQTGHLSNVRFWECHPIYNNSDSSAVRVHVCGLSGTLHAITVYHSHVWYDPTRWSLGAHDHGTGHNC